MKRIFISVFVFALLLTNNVAFADEQQGAYIKFIDVATTHPYYDSIRWLHVNGVVEGYADGSFKPDDKVNRAEFLKMLYGVQGVDAAAYNFDFMFEDSVNEATVFSDVSSGNWYANYVLMAYSDGVIDGYPDKTFRPGNNINTAEALKIIGEAFFDMEEQYSEDANYNNPCYGWDSGDIGSVVSFDAWYWPYIYVLDGSCVIPRPIVTNKFSRVAFNPELDITRGEMAELIYRAKAVSDNSNGLLTAVYNENIEPQSLLEEGEFTFAQLYPGYEVAGMTVKDVEWPSQYPKVYFEGEVIVEGVYTFYPWDTVLGGTISFVVDDDEYKDLFPKYAPKSDFNVTFDFSNYDFAKDFFEEGGVDSAIVKFENFVYSPHTRSKMDFVELVSAE